MLIHNLEIYWGPVGALSAEISDAFGGLYAQTNMYFSPGMNPSKSVDGGEQPETTSPHQDAQSTFIVQLEGEKVTTCWCWWWWRWGGW